MNRGIIYPGAIPLETDLLYAQQQGMLALSKLAAAILGTTTQYTGLAVTQTGVASMNVQVAPGDIYQLVSLEATAYSSLAADTTHSILKQGVSLDNVLLALTAPGTGGFSINYLIQATFAEVDATPVVLPYYNASNPAVAYSGPANAGTAQNTRRTGTVVLSAKAGVAAATGTQVTPAPDAGYVGLAVVTVANGAATVVNANISAYGGPLITPYTSLPVSADSARVVGLVGANNAGTPNTQFDLRADAVTLRDPVTKNCYTVAPAGTLTNNLLTAGPAANGRDQAGAFASSIWIHFYFIYNPTTQTVATISSLTAPATGPALPAGYTAWAYATAIYYNGSSILASVFTRGSWTRYKATIAVLAGGTATASTNVDVSTFVPPNALEMQMVVPQLGITSTAGGSYATTLSIESVSGFSIAQVGMQGLGQASAAFAAISGTLPPVPNIGQAFRYSVSNGAGTGATATINMQGYKVPNGGE